MAHSLGNLVMFEGMRLLRIDHATPVAKNVLAVEAAIWKEAFEPDAPLTYVVGGGEYQAAQAGDEITYPVDPNDALSLKRHSWRGWFRQRDANGQELDLHNVIRGQMYNSYNENDFALNAMRLNDWIRHTGQYDRLKWGIIGQNPPQHGNPGTYIYGRVTRGLRTPIGDVPGRDDQSLSTIPALMRHRDDLHIDDINLAMIGLNFNAFLYGRPNHPNPTGDGAWTLPTNLALGQWGGNFGGYFVPIDAAGEFQWSFSSHGAAFYRGDERWSGNNDVDQSPVDPGQAANTELQTYNTSYSILSRWYSAVFIDRPVFRIGN